MHFEWVVREKILEKMEVYWQVFFLLFFFLSCYIPEKITFTNAPSPQEFTEGDNANIVCDVIGSPTPSVIWKYKGARIQMEKDGKSFKGQQDLLDMEIFLLSDLEEGAIHDVTKSGRFCLPPSLWQTLADEYSIVSN